MVVLWLLVNFPGDNIILGFCCTAGISDSRQRKEAEKLGAVLSSIFSFHLGQTRSQNLLPNRYIFHQNDPFDAKFILCKIQCQQKKKSVDGNDKLSNPGLDFCGVLEPVFQR